MTLAIELKQLSKTYRRAWRRSNEALRQLELTVAAGETFGFVGPNGAGKSTTIKIMMGLLEPTAGEARMFGLPVSGPESRRGIAYVPESPLLYDYLTPLETLQLGCRMQGVALNDLRRHCMSWLERFDLAHVAQRPIKSFSKGMTQRTALAHAMALQPKLLVLDEPLSGLDPLGRSLVIDVLAQYKAQGGTLFFSSHVLYDVERLADRYGVIHKGVLRTISRPEELLQNDARVHVSSYGAEAVPGFECQTGGYWHGEFSRAELWSVLNRLQQAGHRVDEIKPVASLERAVLEWIKSDA